MTSRTPARRPVPPTPAQRQRQRRRRRKPASEGAAAQTRPPTSQLFHFPAEPLHIVSGVRTTQRATRSYRAKQREDGTFDRSEWLDVKHTLGAPRLPPQPVPTAVPR